MTGKCKTLKLPESLRLFVAIAPLVFLFGGCYYGYGWFVPYAVQPSYHKFKKMCELNKLPDNEEKYNKILAYVDLSLDDLDWDELNKKASKIKETNLDYVKDVAEYRTEVAERWISRGDYGVWVYTNKNGFSRTNITKMEIAIDWRTRKKQIVFGNEGNMGIYAYEETYGCNLLLSKGKYKDKK